MEKETYNNLGSKKKYTIDDLKQFNDIEPITIEDILEEIKEQIKEAKILGKLTSKKDVFLYIDSSSMCNLTIPTMIQKIFIKYPDIKYSNIIIIYSNISKAENMYKFIHHYSAVRYDKLSFNLDLLSNKIPFKMPNILILTTNLMFDNKFLISEEISYLKIYNKWKDIHIKNELNDNAQINMFVELLSYFNTTKGIILSHDKMMCYKIKQMMIKIPNLYNLESQDFKKSI